MGHPDKVADQVADAFLDVMLTVDPDARVACEILVTGSQLVVAGEASSSVHIPTADEIEQIVRETVIAIGYHDEALGFDGKTARVEVLLQPQSPDIALGVDASDGELGAGDQGMMFGYANRET
ncbi:methionine adenosyltransferase, partial [bacterium]|nr:methionine adenosyltransferase [bacterium]